MQLFVRNLEARSIAYELCGSSSTVGDLKDLVEACDGIPRACQGLVYAGKQLNDDGRTLISVGLGPGSTAHLVLRLVGGKGGFGALLRGQGRGGEVTTNFDACRDLSGRRLRHAEADAKLKEWRACAKERETYAAEQKRKREEEKEARRQAVAEIDESQVREEQKRSTRTVLEAVQSALVAAPPTAIAAARAKRASAAAADASTSAAVAASASLPSSHKRAKVMSALDAVSDDSGSSSDEEEAAAK